MLGCYPLFEDGLCNFIVADFDDHHSVIGATLLDDVKRFYEVCEVHKIYCYIFRSKSGKGYHVYSFFDGPVPAWKARKVILALLEEAEFFDESVDGNSSGFDRLFPNQDSISEGGVGNLVALPFQGNAARNGRHTLLLNHETGFVQEYSNSRQWEILSQLERVSEGQIDVLIQEWSLLENDKSAQKEKGVVLKFGNKGESCDLVESCKFMRFCKESPEKVSEPLWFAMISNLICIRPGGYSMVHELSKGYPGYSRIETDSKIHHAIDNSSPHTCRYIKENGFDCGMDCCVKSPAVLLIKSKEFKAKGKAVG